MKCFYSLIGAPRISLMMFLMIFRFVANKSVASAESGPVILIHASQIEIAGLSEIAKAIEAEGYIVLPYEEQSLFTNSLADASAFIASAVNEVAEFYPGQDIKIVAACNGGVAGQHFLKNYSTEAALVSHYVSYTSAQQGTLLAPLGVLVNTIPGYADIIGQISGETITLINNKFFYPIASEEEYKAGLPHMTRSVAIDRCCDHYGWFGWFTCYPFFAMDLPLKIKAFLLAWGYDPDLVYTDFDDVLRTVMLELYVADKYMRFAGHDGGYDINPLVPIYQTLIPTDDVMVSLNEAPLPAHVKATNIYGCMDWILKPYSSGFLEGATNVLICHGDHTPTADHPYDETIDEISMHWSVYYQPKVINRIVEALD